jgi:hypothetical protein
MSSLHVSDKGALTAEPVRILDQRVRQLRRRTVDQVKVQWDSYSPHSATWEDAYDMRQCNIPLWRTDKTYSLRTLARK